MYTYSVSFSSGLIMLDGVTKEEKKENLRTTFEGRVKYNPLEPPPPRFREETPT